MSVFVKNEQDSRSTDIVFLKNKVNDYAQSGWSYINGSINSNIGTGICQLRMATISGSYYSIDDGWVHIFDSVHHWAYNVPNNEWEFMDYGQHNAFSDDTMVASIGEDIYLYRNFSDNSTRGIYVWNKRYSRYDKLSELPEGPYSTASLIFSFGTYLHVICGSKHFKISKSDLDDLNVSVSDKNWIELSPWISPDNPNYGAITGFYPINIGVVKSELEGIVYVIFHKLGYRWIEQTDTFEKLPETEFLLSGRGIEGSAVFLIEDISSSHLINVVGGFNGSIMEGPETSQHIVFYNDNQKYQVYDKLSTNVITNSLNADFRGSRDLGYGCAAFMYDNAIYIVNGYNKAVYKFLHLVYETVPISSMVEWAGLNVNKLNNNLHHSKFVYHGDRLFCFYGRQMYELSGLSWTSICSTQFNEQEGTPLSCNGNLYFVADYHESGYTSIDKGLYLYSVSNNSWSKIADLPDFGSVIVEDDRGARHVLAAVLNNEIHVVYGQKHYKYSNNSWVLVSTLPISKGENGYLLSYSGDNKLILFHNTRWYIFNYSTNQWTQQNTQLPCSFGSGSGYIYNDTIHILVSNYHYTFENSQWVLKETLNWVYSDNGVDFYGDLNQYSYYGPIASIENFKTAVTDLSGNFKIYENSVPLSYSHIFNKIKGIWTKIKVPTYDQYGNCTMVEQAKRVKAVWVGNQNNLARRVF